MDTDAQKAGRGSAVDVVWSGYGLKFQTIILTLCIKWGGNLNNPFIAVWIFRLSSTLLVTIRP